MPRKYTKQSHRQFRANSINARRNPERFAYNGRGPKLSRTVPKDGAGDSQAASPEATKKKPR